MVSANNTRDVSIKCRPSTGREGGGEKGAMEQKGIGREEKEDIRETGWEERKRQRGRMNKKPNYKKGTRREIIMAEHMDGLITNLGFETLDTPRTYKEKTKEMLAEGVLEKTKVTLDRRIINVYTLNRYEDNKSPYIESLPDGYYETYVMYMAEDGRKARKKNKSEAGRAIGNANTSFIMQASGIKRRIEEKPRITGEEKMKGGLTAYYTARELKWYTGFTPDISLSKEGEKTVLNSRVNGLAITPGGVYPTYYIGSNVDEWKKGAEIKMKVHLENMLGKKFDEPKRIDGAVILTTAYERLGKLLGGLEIQGGSIMQLAGMYENVYVLPYSKEGRKMLTTMGIGEWKRKLYETYGKGFTRDRAETYSVRCDGYSPEKDTLLCLFMDCDVKKLDMFTSYAKAVGERDRFTVVCFDWQREVALKACGGACRILVTKFGPFYESMRRKSTPQGSS